MLALYRSDRQAEALQVYQDARRMLVEELGIEPSQGLQRLEQSILTQTWLSNRPWPSGHGRSSGARSIVEALAGRCSGTSVCSLPYSLRPPQSAEPPRNLRLE